MVEFNIKLAKVPDSSPYLAPGTQAVCAKVTQAQRTRGNVDAVLMDEPLDIGLAERESWG